jgi:hypothetical protein
MNRPGGIALVGALAAVLVVALAVAPAGLAGPGHHRHALAKRLPARWLRAHDLSGRAAAPLADPDHDGVVNFVEWRRHTDPMQPNQVATAPATGSAPVRSVIRLEGTVAAISPTSLSVQLDGGLTVQVALPAGAPVVDEDGFPATPAVGDEVKVFATQSSNLSLTAVIVFAEGAQGAPGDDDSNDQGQGQGPGGDNGNPGVEHGGDG